MTISRRLRSLAKDQEVALTEEQAELLQSFHEAIRKTNKLLNITSRAGDEESSILSQILDSITSQPVIEMKDPKNILDLGSGGGLPGIPLSIINPNRKFYLLESSIKKIGHLLNTVLYLKIQNAMPIHNRMETLIRQGKPNQFDMIITRAATSIEKAMKWSELALTPNGTLLAYAGRGQMKEITKLLNSENPIRAKIDILDTGIWPGEKIRQIWTITPPYHEGATHQEKPWPCEARH